MKKYLTLRNIGIALVAIIVIWFIATRVLNKKTTTAQYQTSQVEKDNLIYFTKAFIHLRPKSLSKILYYSLREIFYENLIIVSRQGKGYPTLKAVDLKYIKFDKNVIESLKRKKQEIFSFV